jgi:hypothetical protein
MKVAIMQPYFFPYIGYFQLIAAADKFVVYDDVNYINRGWINRNNFLVNGVTTLIQIPLSGASQNKLINEVEILNEAKWKVKILRTIEQSYKKAPFFLAVYDLIESQINKGHTHIARLNVESTLAVCKYLGINTQIIPSSSCYQNKQLRGQNRILDICKKENADHYINPIGGIELYDRELFNENQIQLNFIQSSAVSYQQFNNVFAPYLSIIDVLMFCEPEYIKTKLLKAYELI